MLFIKSNFFRYFDPIYDFYAAGKLHVPKDLCFDKFMGELRFWSVSKAKMDDCCSPFAQFCLMRKLPIDQPVMRFYYYLTLIILYLQ